MLGLQRLGVSGDARVHEVRGGSDGHQGSRSCREPCTEKAGRQTWSPGHGLLGHGLGTGAETDDRSMFLDQRAVGGG